MFKKFLILFLTMLLCLSLGLGIVGCSKGRAPSKPSKSSESLGASQSSSSAGDVNTSSSADISQLFDLVIKLNNGQTDLTIEVADNENLSKYEPTGITNGEREFIGWYCNGEKFSFDTIATKSIVVEAIWEGTNHVSSSGTNSSTPSVQTEFPIRLYSNEIDYVTVKYKAGDTVSVANWPLPEKIYFEGKEIPFIGWWNEPITAQVTGSFTMPSKSMAFYARYDYPLSNMWYYDHEKDIYLSNGSGSRTIEGLGGVCGRYSATFNVKNASTTGIGIIWNATIAEVNNPYDYTTGSTYWYMHLNPTNGGFQLANVVTAYTVAGGVTLANSPSAWQEKWNAYKLNGGTLSMKFSVEFCDSFIKLYVDDNLLLTYEGELLGSVKGTGVGMRTNALGNEVIKTEFETLSYDTMYNWEYNSTNKTYTSQGAGIAPIVDMGGYSYGVYSADLKVGDTTTTGFGIIWGATIANVVNPYDYATGSSYWYFHHNPNAGTFQLANVSVEKNAYKAVKSVTLANAPANFQTKWNAWNDGGRTAEYVINMKVEFTHESITMYIDGDMLLTFNASSTNGEYFGSLSGKTIGVRTNKAGNIVSNVLFTPYQYNWEYNETNKTYTSIGAGIIPTNLTAGTSGTYSADFTINPSSITSSSMGIFFNGTMSTEDLPYEGQCKYFYLNLNVHNGGNFQLAKLDGSYKSLAYVYKTNLTGWNAKWSAWNDGGRAEALTFNLKVEFSATSIKVYVDNELITTYSGEDVGSLSGTAVGVRSNFAGNVVTNAVFTPSGT